MDSAAESSVSRVTYHAEISCPFGVESRFEEILEVDATSAKHIDVFPIIDRVAMVADKMWTHLSNGCPSRSYAFPPLFQLNLNYIPPYDSIIAYDGIILKTLQLNRQEQGELEVKIGERLRVLRKSYEENIQREREQKQEEIIK